MDNQKNNGMCRCCASEGTFKDVKTAYQWMGEEEVYAEMLRECLDISLCPDDAGEVEGGICEVCITQLRNASNFKKQVLHTEEQFKRSLQEGLFKSDIVKVEVAPTEGESDNDNDMSEDYGTEFEVPVKTETVEEPKAKKRGAKAIKASTSRVKKLKAEDGESSKRGRQIIYERGHTARKSFRLLTQDHKINDVPESSKDNLKTPRVGLVKITNQEAQSRSKLNIFGKKSRMITIKTNSRMELLEAEISDKCLGDKNEVDGHRSNIEQTCSKLDRVHSKKTRFITIKTDSSTPKKEKLKNNSVGDQYKLEKLRANIQQILLYSNATPIQRGGLSYSCDFCFEHFPNPQKLKQHNLVDHCDEERRVYTNHTGLGGFVVKLDITNLQCKLCDNDTKNIKNLLAHLKNDHGKTVYLDEDGHIVPFKFDDDKLACAICETVYHSFKSLQEHMNSHYGNYVCEQCSAGFVCHNRLRTHMTGHKEAEAVPTFECTICSKAFPTRVRLNNHMKSVHLGPNIICSFCGESFADYKSRFKHLSEVHDVQFQIRECQACGKTFSTASDFQHHYKYHHLMERNHACVVCDKRFHNKIALDSHMVSHTGARDFQCDVCQKWYGRKKTLKEHMRIHLNDRRFACTHCGEAFVQKTCLKGHLRSKHKEIL